MVYGGLFHKAENMSKLCDFLVGKKASKELIADAIKVLQEDIKGIEDEEVVETLSGAKAVRHNAAYRMNLAAGFLLKYLVGMAITDEADDAVTVASLSTHSERSVTKSIQSFDYPSMCNMFFFLFFFFFSMSSFFFVAAVMGLICIRVERRIDIDRHSRSYPCVSLCFSMLCNPNF